MLPPRRCSRDALPAVAAECDYLSLRLETPTLSVRYTARNPAMPPVPIVSYTGDSLPDCELASHAAGRRAPTNRPPQWARTPDPTVPFKPSRIDPLNREPTARPGSTVPSKPSSIDPLNREPGAFPDPDPRPVHRFHEPAHIHKPKRCVAHAKPAPQARKYSPQMNADER